MIEFSCDQCGKRFSMANEYAGRRGKCKQCGQLLVVPSPEDESVSPVASERPSQTASPTTRSPSLEATTPAKAKKPSVRHRRLAADAAQVRAAFEHSDLIQILTTTGQPPEAYQIQYNVQGLARGAGDQPVPRQQHIAEIRLTRDYPRQSPQCKMLTPVFHPNIEPAMICVGDHWTAGERLVDLIVRIGEMITYQAYNIKSPLDGEAAMWADLNSARLPLDHRNLHPAE